MPTVVKTWSWPSDADGWTDQGSSQWLAFSWDSTDKAIKEVCTRKSLSGVAEQMASGGVTWETLGVPAGATVTAVQITAWKKKVVGNTNLTSHECRMRLLSGGTNICGADLISTSGWATATDGSYVSGAAGTQRSVNASYRASTTTVVMVVEHVVTTPNSTPAIDVRWDDVELTITYQNGQSDAGSITPAGSLTFRVIPVAMTGAATPGGELTKRSALATTGGLTSTGAETHSRTAYQTVAGVDTPAGTMSGQKSTPHQELDGGLTPTGEVTKHVQRAFGGAMDLVGSVVKLVNRLFGGDL